LAAKLAEAEKGIAAVRARALGEVGKIAGDTVGLIVNELIGATATGTEIDEAVRSAGRE
jgi:F-type H+-transporting ATPase subunit b